MHLEENTDTALTFSAGCALAAALMFVELNQTGDSSDNISLQQKYTHHRKRCFFFINDKLIKRK